MVTKNHPFYRLEKKRGSFLAIGLSVSLFIVLTAMEWRTAIESPPPPQEYEIAEIDDIDIVITERQKKKVEPPRQKPQIALVQQPVQELVPDDTPDPVPDPEIPDSILYPDPGPEIIDEPDAPFKVVEIMPQFRNGFKDLMIYIHDNVKYPQLAKDVGREGIVYVQFVVNRRGEVVDAKVVRGIGYGCDKEALRVVKAMPKWKPGRQRGKRVPVEFTLPIKYELR